MTNANTAVAERPAEDGDVPRKAVAVVREAIPSRDVTAGVSRTAFVPSSMGEAMEVAKLMAAGNFVPGHLRNRPGDCLAVVMQAARWAMDPFAVGNKTYFVNDRMAYEAQLVNAVVNSSNLLEGRLKVEWKGSGNDLECFVSGKVKGDPDIKVRHVRINTITTRNSPLWKQDPEQQIAYYTTRAWARLHTPEVLLGVYTPDEVASMTVDGGMLTNQPDPSRQRLSSAMLAQQAGAVVDQPETVKHDADGVVIEPEQGRADEDHGDQHSGAEPEREEGAGEDGDLPPWTDAVQDIRDTVHGAKSIDEIKEARLKLDRIAATLPSHVEKELDETIRDARAAFQAKGA